jgi:Ala-tRNA(Pro) deacylase
VIPMMIEAHLTSRYGHIERHTHAVAMTAQDLAAAEHIQGRRVAKPVVVRLDGRLALAVVAASDRVALGTLEEATAARAELVPENEFTGLFRPCEPGTEPPLALFGLPIFADEKLLREPNLLMPAGTHLDAVVLDVHAWMQAERVQPVANLGTRMLQA